MINERKFYARICVGFFFKRVTCHEGVRLSRMNSCVRANYEKKRLFAFEFDDRKTKVGRQTWGTNAAGAVADINVEILP